MGLGIAGSLAEAWEMVGLVGQREGQPHSCALGSQEQWEQKNPVRCLLVLLGPDLGLLWCQEVFRRRSKGGASAVKADKWEPSLPCCAVAALCPTAAGALLHLRNKHDLGGF